MNKKNLSESDLCDKIIRPAIVSAGWDTQEQIYAQYPLRAGRVVVLGQQSHRDPQQLNYVDNQPFTTLKSILAQSLTKP